MKDNLADNNSLQGIAFPVERSDLLPMIAESIGTIDENMLNQFKSIFGATNTSPILESSCGCAAACSGCGCGCSTPSSTPLSFNEQSEFNPGSDWQSPNFFGN